MHKGKIIASLGIVLLTIILITLVVIFSKNRLFNSKNDGGYDHLKKTAVFHSTKFAVPKEITQPSLSYSDLVINIEDSTPTDVLGSKSQKNKRIEVNLSTQKLNAYEGDKKKMSFDVSTGKWAETPTGEFQIWTKLKYTLMTGGSKDMGTYYYLPNVPYTMYFYKDFGIHGAYWHNNFGHPMSHGCVNMRIADAERLFYWANPTLPGKANSVLATKDNTGTRVVIYGETPRE